jgi:hypothetical protein
MAQLAAAAAALSDVDLLSCPADLSVPVGGACPETHKTLALLHKAPTPARNALQLAAAADWRLQQQRSELTTAALEVDSCCQAAWRCQPAGAGVVGSTMGSTVLSELVQWAGSLAVRGGEDDGSSSLAAVLAQLDEQLSEGLFGSEESIGCTAGLNVSQAAAEALLQQQVQMLNQPVPANAAAATATSGDCAGSKAHRQLLLPPQQQRQQQQPQQQGVPLLNRLSSFANVLLLAGPSCFTIGCGAGAAADRLSALGSICQSEALRLAGLSAATALRGRGARRAAVFEHYLMQKLPGVAAEGHLMTALTAMAARTC